MKTILCFGDSNVRGVIPEIITDKTILTKRYTKKKRWTGILQEKLGEEYEIIEEGMGGRTTIFDEIIPGRPYRNGLTQLPVCLESHYPIDIVILMLGTNDVKTQFNTTAEQITQGMFQLIKTIQNSNKGPELKAPKILIICPPPIIKIPNLYPLFDNFSITKSEQLADHYQSLAEKNNCDFLDAGTIIHSSQIDGFHLDEDQCFIFGKAIAEKVLSNFKKLK